MTEGSNTRSALLWEIKRLFLETLNSKYSLPQILVMENVCQIISKTNLPDFTKWCNFLEELGYTNYYQPLSADDYGIPQTRKRVFMVSFLNDATPYQFPSPIPLTKYAQEFLEDEVDKKYYANKLTLSLIGIGKLHRDKNIDHFKYRGKIIKPHTSLASVADKGATVLKEKITAGTLLSRDYKGFSNQSMNGVIKFWDGYNRQLRVTKNTIGVLTTKCGNDLKRNGWGVATFSSKIKRQREICPTHYITLRKLTPIECFRFMGFSDKDCEKAAAVCTDTQLYKQAGNSIVVPVLEAIFATIFKEKK